MRKNRTITTQQEKELLLAAKEGKGLKKERAMRQIINYNLNLVKYIVTRYFSFARLDYDELVSEGIRSLPKAIEKFDLNSKNRFAVYAGCWIKQYIRSYIEKTKLIKSSLTNPKEVIYYEDNTYQSDDKNTYSLLDTVSSDFHETNREEIRQHDIARLTNDLINSLNNREMILLVRLFYKIAPISLLDVYYLVPEEDKKILLKEVKLSAKLGAKQIEAHLSKHSCQEKKKNQLSLIKKYLDLFSPNYQHKFSEMAKIIGKSENYVRKLKQESFIKLQQLAQEKNLQLI